MIELIDKRKPNEKHFLKENGNIEIQMFRNNIHYLKDGKYEEISNELKESEDTLENIENDYKVFFNKRTGSIKYIKNNNYLEFTPKDTKNIECIIEKNTKEVSKVLYKNIFENIDLEYVLSFEGVKENIIINEYSKINKIQFYLDTNLDIENENNTIEAKSDKEVVFSFNVPYMKDENGNESDEVFYEINNKDSSKILMMTFSDDWLKSNERKYPVVIDPSMETNDRGVDDTYIYPGDTNDVRYNRDYIIAGVTKVNNQDRVNRGLLKFVLPELGTSDEIIRAELNLYGYMAVLESRVLTPQEALDNTDKIVSIHEVTSDWTLQNANWNNMNNAYNQDVQNIAFISRSYLKESLEDASLEPVISTSKNDCLITDLVKRWYSGSPNYGLMIKQVEETYINQMTPMFFSSNYGEGGLAPVLTIEYRNQNGLESYWDFIPQSFTNGATYVNSFNGNLVGLFNLSSTIGVFPANVGLVYNTNDVILNNNTIYGKGFKLTCDQTIEKITIGETEKLRYVDNDGTIHYFHLLDGKYKDEDGLDLEIEYSNDTCVLKDKNGNGLIFNKNGSYYYLSKIKNISNQEINIVRNENDYITKVIDYNSNEINVAYEENKITFTSPSDTTILNYTNDNIQTIITKEGTTTFVYDTSNIITKIIDVTGLSIEYEYYNGSTRKVKKVTQYGLDNTEGQSFVISYGLFNTKIEDNNNKIISKVFNYYGNLLSENSMSNGSNLKKAYSLSSTYGNEDNNKNRILSNTIPIRYSKNYFKLTDYDTINSDFIFSIDTDIYNEDFSFDGVKAICIRSSEANGGIDYIRPLGNNEPWTVSLKVKTLGRVKVSFYEWQSHQILYEKIIDASEDFEKVVFISNGEQFSFEIINEIANINTYIGDIQLEKGDCLSDYNAIDNSDFADGTDDWTLSASEYDSNNELNINDIFEVVEIDNDGNKALKVNMHPQNMSDISKVINVKGSSDDLFYLAFWFKNEGLETGVDPTIAHDGSGSIVGNTVSVYFEPLEGDLEQCIPTFELNVNKDVWQYYSMPFAPTKDYKSIKIMLHQGREAGSLYITNFSLFKKLKTDKYEYDENGNIKEIKDINESNIFKYDKNNELISATNPRGRHFKIEYDNNITDRVIRAISSSGISNKVDYDNFGNPIRTRISKDYSDEISTGYYKIRQKGTNNYLKIQDNNLVLKPDYCSNTTFKVESVENGYYKISDVVMPDKYITEMSCGIILNNTGNNLFKIEKNNNASYHIYLADSCDNRKYLKWIDDHFECVANISDLEENYLYEYYFEDSTREFIETDASYSSDGRFIESVKDSLLNETKYVTNNLNGLVTKTINPKGIETEYTYDNKNRVTKIKKNNKEINYTYNNQNKVSTIIQDKKIVSITYDNFLDVASVSMNNNILISNSYEIKKGNLLSSIFGNDNIIEYQYDEFDRVKKIIKSDDAFEYSYNNNGDVHKIKEGSSDSYYLYDDRKRLNDYTNNRYYTTSYIDQDSNEITEYHKKTFNINYDYDDDSNPIKKNYKLNLEISNKTNNITNSFSNEGLILESSYDNNFSIQYFYDELLRITNKKINNSFETNYDYYSIGNRTSSIVKNITNGNNMYTYKYDNVYNITDIYHNNQLLYHYEYNDDNELIIEEDYFNNVKAEYLYNSSGNIITKTKKDLTTNVIINTDVYEYNNSNWEDLLTRYNDDIIIYDAIGNPISIGNKTLTWINGRQLQSYSSNDLTITYKYNVNGIRTEKVVNGIKTDYYLSDKNIIYEKTNDNLIYYFYDSSGPAGLEYNSMIYYYVKNLHGDIVGILNSNYEQVVKYEYDAYGNILSIKDSSNQVILDQLNVGNINPFRYRGYYYDKETNLYYLNSRYYNPEWCRFINSDKILGINRDFLSYNLFLYVSNNPIMYFDNTGFGKTYVIAYNPPEKLSDKTLYNQADNSAEYDSSDTENVIIVSVTSGEDFVEAWNSMDNYGEIDNVYLYLHGGKGVLYFYKESFELEDFKKLEYQIVKNNVYNYSCKGASGHTSGTSVIDALSKKTNARVTGNLFGVSYYKSNNGYKARTEILNIDKIIHGITFQPNWITVQKKQTNIVPQVVTLAGTLLRAALVALKNK